MTLVQSRNSVSAGAWAHRGPAPSNAPTKLFWGQGALADFRAAQKKLKRALACAEDDGDRAWVRELSTQLVRVEHAIEDLEKLFPKGMNR